VPGGLISKCVCDVVIIPGSDHLPLICSFKSLNRGKSGSQDEVKVRQLNSANLIIFKEAISCASWNEVLEEKDNVSVAFDNFLDVLLPIYDSYCPIKILKRSKREPRQPWINAAITGSIEERNYLYRLHLEFSTQENLKNFKRARNLVNSLRRSCARNYYSEKFRENAGDMKGT